MPDVVYDYNSCKDLKHKIYKRSEKAKEKSRDVQLLEHFS